MFPKFQGVSDMLIIKMVCSCIIIKLGGNAALEDKDLLMQFFLYNAISE